MSNTLAIATVTACIRNLLEHALRNDPDDPLVGAEVRMLWPGSANLPTLGALLFLARITPSAAWQGVDLPTRGSSGQLLAKPQVGVRLHYLIAVRGDEQAYEPHRIAAVIARVLAATPVLSRNLIAAAIAAQTGLLGHSNLAEAPDPVRITPETISTEELSKIWTAYPQASQGPWLAYEAMTVVLDTDVGVAPALPVQERGIYANAIAFARITGVSSAASSSGPILAGTMIAMTGYNLAVGEAVRVFFDGQAMGLVPASTAATSVTVTLPPDLLPGTHGVLVARMATIAGELRRIAESNFFAFTLSPAILSMATSEMVSAVQDGVTLWTGNVVVTCNSAVGSEQRFELVLNGLGDATRSYVFAAPRRPGPLPSSSITVPIRAVPSGTYLVRIRVDGATSGLEGGGTTPYSGPTMTF